MATGVLSWSKTAATNASADSAVNFAEGQAPSSINDSARGLMASVAKYRDDISGMITLGGGTTAYTFASNQSIALTDGAQIAFTVNSTNTGASTLNVDSTGAVPLQKVKGTDLAAGELVAGEVYTATYDSASTATWVIHGGGLSVQIPIGMVAPFAGTSAPSGWLFCYGQAVSRSTYASLFAVISTNYGTGDGSTTFNLPDLRGRAVAGKDDMGGSSANRLTAQTGGLNGDTLGASGGSETHTLLKAQLPTDAVSGTVSAPTITIKVGELRTPGTGSSENVAIVGGSNNTTLATASTPTFTGAAMGSGSAHNNVQPTFILNYIIKY